MTVLVVYESIEGQTRKVAQFVEMQIRAAGYEVRRIDAADRTAPVSFETVDSVILAAPVHERRHPESFEVFLAASRQELMARHSLLLSVSLSAAFPEGLEEAREYITEMQMRTRFTPNVAAPVAGAVQASGYDYFAQQVLRHNVLRDRQVLLDQKAHEFTDWDALAREVSAFLAPVPSVS